MKRFVLRYSDKFVSRWLVLAIDLAIIAAAFGITALIKYGFSGHEGVWLELPYQLPAVMAVRLVAFLVFESYAGIVRHTTVSDAVLVTKATALGTVLLIGLSLVGYKYNYDVFKISPSTIIVDFVFSATLLVSSRFVFKAIFRYIAGSTKDRIPVLIFGAGRSGIITKNTLLQHGHVNYQIVGFIDDNPSKHGKMLEGIKIFEPQAINQEFIESKRVREIIISIQSGISVKRKAALVDSFLHFNIAIKTVPPVDKWINGELSLKQIKNVNIDDLLGRDPITLDSANVSQEIQGKRVLVTGAAGSIGSEIARQVAQYHPDSVMLIDSAESPIYDLECEFKQKLNGLFKKIKFIVADVRDYYRIQKLIEDFKPQIIFHAAAYKHVPLMEANPYEAIRINVLGTKNLADLAVLHQVQKFVMVSTDKAVNPTNVMGATKRAAELYTQSLNQSNSKTRFITTRFGNVLGSNGSVIPLFRKQIEQGVAITVTHPDITRYFMTIPEACQLVLEAGSMGKGGEIFIFDMGESVKIVDLAKKMIKLSGLELGKDIEIKFSGLRPGEKLYEELLNNSENTQPTYHPKIMIAKVPPSNPAAVKLQVDRLLTDLNHGSDHVLVGLLKDLVPEFVSNNSEFEVLDKQSKRN